MACDQVHGIFDAGDAASGFDLTHPLLEEPLPFSGSDDREAVCLRDRGIVGYPLLQFPFP
jgi:hypothetical protein